ncbi:MAG TPA: protein kinase, partial [Sandaracinaceae bacterium LLY-WYZ-13_1]|nr:protein kinase [Sandaracinaceae bacterium LLY-WYZ-13_1]
MDDALAKVCPKCGRRYDTAADFCQKDGVRLHLTDEQADPYIGQNLLDQFKIEEKIGAGGMGSVYRARQTTLHRDVAIKILHPELADNRDAVRRFKREARVCTALDHPNVVRVFLFGQLPDGSLYIVMEFLRGRSLLDVIQRDGALPVHRALHIATQICDGVGEAHAQGVVHRDLKPENVVLVSKSRDPDFVKVLDFGIARVLWGDEVTQATQSGLVFGTARYISPEGAAGESTDARSDVYGLGVLTYQLLCGETPFDAPSPVAMLMKHIHSTPPHLLSQARARHVPEPVADVVMRALAKNPEGRFDDAHAFGDALRSAAESAGFEVHGRRPVGRPSIGPPSEPGTRAPRSEPGRRDLRGAVTDDDREPPPRREARRRDATPTSPMDEPPRREAGESETLSGAPSPFGGEAEADDELDIPGLTLGRPRRPRPTKTLRTIGLAFLIGAALVAGGFGVRVWLNAPDEGSSVDVEALAQQARTALRQGLYDEPHEGSVLGLTDRILEVRPEHGEARRLREEVASRLMRQAASEAERGDREAARATYRRALAFAADDAPIEEAVAALDEPAPTRPAPGVRTRPAHVVEDREITLVAVLEPDVEVGERTRPRFVLKRGRRQVGRSIEASLGEDGVSWEAAHTIARPGTYQLLFRIGRGSDRIERSADIEVARDPDRPVRRREPDPPPVTTQGSVWS